MQGLGPNDPARQHNHGGGLLTRAVRNLLQAMTEGEEPEDCEAVYEHGAVWVGYKTFRVDTLRKAIQLCAVRDVTEGTGTLDRYVINDVGRAILADPSQADRVVRFLATRTNMTVIDGKVVKLANA